MRSYRVPGIWACPPRALRRIFVLHVCSGCSSLAAFPGSFLLLGLATRLCSVTFLGLIVIRSSQLMWFLRNETNTPGTWSRTKRVTQGRLVMTARYYSTWSTELNRVSLRQLVCFKIPTGMSPRPPTHKSSGLPTQLTWRSPPPTLPYRKLNSGVQIKARDFSVLPYTNQGHRTFLWPAAFFGFFTVQSRSPLPPGLDRGLALAVLVTLLFRKILSLRRGCQSSSNKDTPDRGSTGSKIMLNPGFLTSFTISEASVGLSSSWLFSTLTVAPAEVSVDSTCSWLWSSLKISSSKSSSSSSWLRIDSARHSSSSSSTSSSSSSSEGSLSSTFFVLFFLETFPTWHAEQKLNRTYTKHKKPHPHWYCLFTPRLICQCFSFHTEYKCCWCWC